MDLTMQERYRGAMVGVLCGDALGAPYEWKKRDEVRTDIKARGGLVAHEYEPFDYIEPWKKKRTVLKGHPTDDSELAAALAQSLAEVGTLDNEDVYNRLRSFIIDRKSILTDKAYGSGSTLRAALTPESYELSVAEFALGNIPRNPSNGSLMRCTPIPLRFRRRLDVHEHAMQQSRITHMNPVCQAVCAAYSVFVVNLLEGMAPERAWYYAQHPLRVRATAENCFMEAVTIDVSEPTDADIWPASPRGPGDALLSLRVAVWATVTASSFADGIIKSISIGGDTDTYAAIAGGALGAHFGLDAIPQAWQDVLQGKDIMLNLAHKLYRQAAA